MIELDVWVDGICSTAELVAEEGLFEKVWLKGDKSITSILEPEELFEQIFEGLDADNFENSKEFNLQLDSYQKQKISNFLAKLRELEEYVNLNDLNDDPSIVLKCKVWIELRAIASSLKFH
jgi:hypothetical protein